MSELENCSPFSVTRGKSPYEPAGGTADSGATSSEFLATGEYRSPFTTTVHKPEPRRRNGHQNSTAQMVPSQALAALRAHWKAAKASAQSIVSAAESEDRMELTIAGDNLDMALAKLWDLRDQRDANWQTILNHAQAMLKQLFAEKRVEQLTADQCRAIRELVENYLGTSTKTAGDLNEAIRLIEDAGCDPYWAISGDPTEPESAQTPE